ncbi:MAG: acyl-CoA reductase [Chitinophagia bacterium]|nr:acyl-CoA reductase [Chitinophagia bacterium]
MKLEERIEVLAALADRLRPGDADWDDAVHRAHAANGWFHPRFVSLAAENIRHAFLRAEELRELALRHDLYKRPVEPRTVGIVMAGNIPMVGMHDLVCAFLSGHSVLAKPSERDRVLLEYIVESLRQTHPDAAGQITLSERLTGCDAYIATGSDNTALHFERYFGARPHIIRRNRTSVAVLLGDETAGELEGLADDVCTYFGLGCRNVTQLLVPEGYDFIPLLDALRKYEWQRDEHKYRNNLDYNLTLQILNRRFYMTNDSILLVEDPSPFSPIGQLHYRFVGRDDRISALIDRNRIQCVIGKGETPFGHAQTPGLEDYPDGVDTMAFLRSL